MAARRRVCALAALAALLAVASAARPVKDCELKQQQQQQEMQRPPASRHLLGSSKLLGLDRQNKKLRVLAHGDSITEGWVDSAEIKTPWTPRMQEQLKQKLGWDWDIEVVNGGLGGAGVTDALYPLLQRQLSEARSQGRPYHYIIFEGGINDIMGKTYAPKKAPEIFDRMRQMWAEANAEGATVLVIPTLPTNADDTFESQRRELAAKVRAYIAQQRGAGNRGLVLVDMERDFDYFRLPEDRRRQLFDDGVHLTQAGYEHMGQLAYQGLLGAMGV